MVGKLPLLKQAWSKKLEAHFDTPGTMIREDKMEECYDVCLYQWDGQDKTDLICGVTMQTLASGERDTTVLGCHVMI